MPRKRPALFEVRDSRKHPNRDNGWRIVGFVNGIRKQFWFKSQKEAQIAAADRNAEITAFGTQFVLSPSDRVRAVNAAERLAPFGKNLDDAVNFYLSHLKQLESSIPVSELCKVVRAEFDRRLSKNEASLRHKNTIYEADGHLERNSTTGEIDSIKTRVRPAREISYPTSLPAPGSPDHYSSDCLPVG